MSDQLKQWLNGKSVHGQECVPDFTCCNGKEISPLEVRQRFCKAVEENDDRTRFEILGMFLGQAFENVYVAGLNTKGHGQ